MANEPSETSTGPENAAQTRTQSAATLTHSEKEKEAQQPIYLDSAEGFRRLEERDRRSFVTLGMFFLSQETQTFCGVASSTMALNALVSKKERPLVPEWSPYCLFAQSVFFTAEVEKIAPRNGVLANGMTLQQLGDALGTFPVKVGVSHASDKSEEDFRKDATEALRGSASYLIVNYLRTSVGQVGGGHFSPIAAYHEKSDSFLVYDVARYKYPPSWANTTDLWNAMNTTDSDSGKTRGYLVVTNLPG
jgi:hypothetical protein